MEIGEAVYWIEYYDGEYYIAYGVVTKITCEMGKSTLYGFSGGAWQERDFYWDRYRKDFFTTYEEAVKEKERREAEAGEGIKVEEA